MSEKLATFIGGIKTVIHEAVHAKQFACIEQTEIKGKPINYTAEMYLMALENVAESADRKFYETNYGKLLLENMANKEGFLVCGEFLKKYLDQEEQDKDELINELIEEIMQNMQFDSKSFQDLEIFGKNREKVQGLESACSRYCSQHPEILQKYPILRLKYNDNGIRKNIKTLLREREARLQTGQAEREVNELYKTLTSFGIREIPIRTIKSGMPYEMRHLLVNPVIKYAKTLTDGIYRMMADGKKGSIFDVMLRVNPEIQGIQQYIRETGTDDEFIYELLEERLAMKKLPQEKIEGIIQEQRTIAGEKRKQMDNQQGQEASNTKDVSFWLNRGKNWNDVIDREPQGVKAKFIQMKSDIIKTIRDKILNRDKTVGEKTEEEK